MKSILMFALLIAEAAHGATMLQRTGEPNANCCEFGAYAIGWTQTATWSNVRVDLDIYNYGPSGNLQTGVALLLNALGPGTTEAANEIDDAIVATTVPGQQTVTLFNGLTLGPGTYYVLFYGVTHSFSDFLTVATAAPATTQTLGPGITPLPAMLEDIFASAAYRPASAYQAWPGLQSLIHITGTQDVTAVPEPSTTVLGLSAAAILWLRRRPYSPSLR